LQISCEWSNLGAGTDLLTKLKEFIWMLPPGAAIAMLAVVASLITLVPFEKLKSYRPIILFIILILFAIEISVLAHSRKGQDASHEKEMANLLQHFSFVEQSLNDLRINAVRAQTVNVSSDSLKKRTLGLSDEILHFLVNRQIAPGYGQGGYGEGGYGGTLTGDQQYQKETVAMYTGVFQPRVAAIHDALEKQGLRDSQLDSEFRNPVNAYSVRAIAERLGALAEKLPN
jgi:hypothetical protein